LGSCVIVDPNKPLLSERDQEGALQKQREDGQPIPEPQKLDGEVRIPEGKALSLWLTRGLDSVPLGDISSLDVLRPEDVNEVHVAGRLDLQAARQLSWFTKIRRFYLYSADKDYDTPEGYAELGKLQSLESLTVEVFQDNYFGDDALFKELAGLKRLRWISIPTLRVTDAGMEALLRHPALETICLASHPKLLPLSDRSIRVVQSWPNLRGCVLACGGRLTDPVLRDFGQKKKLESLHLTLKSPAAAEFFLKETLPMCEVQFGVMFLPGEPIEPIGGGTFGIAPVAPAQNRATRPDVVPTPNFPTRPRGKVR
jgi:hypothetical protein